jgi:hypothetical protein
MMLEPVDEVVAEKARGKFCRVNERNFTASSDKIDLTATIIDFCLESETI